MIGSACSLFLLIPFFKKAHDTQTDFSFAGEFQILPSRMHSKTPNFS